MCKFLKLFYNSRQNILGIKKANAMRNSIKKYVRTTVHLVFFVLFFFLYVKQKQTEIIHLKNLTSN